MVEFADQLLGHRPVAGRVVGVVVLVRPVGVGELVQDGPQPGEPGGLPAAAPGGPVDQFQPGAVRAEQLPHGRFEFGVADQDDRVPEGLSGESQADAEGARRGLHHRGTGPEFAARVGAAEHGDGGSGLHAARGEALQLGPEAGVRVR